jgi:hypothetical protein
MYQIVFSHCFGFYLLAQGSVDVSDPSSGGHIENVVSLMSWVKTRQNFSFCLRRHCREHEVNHELVDLAVFLHLFELNDLLEVVAGAT